MNLLHKTSAISFSLLHSGFLTFKNRVRAILSATSGTNLEDYMDDDQLCCFYRNGDSPEFVAATVIGPYCDGEDEDFADAG